MKQSLQIKVSPNTQEFNFTLQFKRVKKNINGILLLDKPLGFSSNQALQRVKWLLQAAKAGHTGTLDPLATGLLPLCFGEATKFAHYLTDADKTYHATIKLGITTATGDAEGAVLTTSPVRVSALQFNLACAQFIGIINQIPPMYSALKHEGKALYEYARQGIEIERKVRTVNIHSIEVLSFSGDVADIKVACSKGTYIRTLSEDIGASLGCGAHLIGLRRTFTAGYDIAQAITLAAFEAMGADERLAKLAAPDSAVDDLPALVLDADSAFYLMQGQAVWQSGKVATGLLRLYDAQHVFLGLGEQQSDGKIAPKRLMQLVND